MRSSFGDHFQAAQRAHTRDPAPRRGPAWLRKSSAPASSPRTRVRRLIEARVHHDHRNCDASRELTLSLRQTSKPSMSASSRRAARCRFGAVAQRPARRFPIAVVTSKYSADSALPELHIGRTSSTTRTRHSSLFPSGWAEKMADGLDELSHEDRLRQIASQPPSRCAPRRPSMAKAVTATTGMPSARNLSFTIWSLRGRHSGVGYPSK